MSEEKDKLRKHSYDGIEEYDNQLPRWWVVKFLITIIFAVSYLYWFHFADVGKGLFDSFKAAQQEESIKQLSLAAKGPKLSEEELRAYTTQPDKLKAGQAVFSSKCSSCHGQKGEGLIGPNFTDKHWIHGNQMTEIVAVIENGVPAKGMIPWKSLLTMEEIKSVAAYIKNLEGTFVANGKAAEGVLIEKP